MLAQAAADGGGSVIPLLCFIVLVASGPIFLFWKSTHCPNCKRVFVRKFLRKEQNIMQKVFTGSEIRFYRCKNCQTEWSKKVTLDG